MTMVEEGDVYAQYALAKYYEEDEKKAFELYNKSAQQGYVPAQRELGICYFIGKGVKEDNEEAVKWLGKAAEQGYSSAMLDLAECYRDGVGLSKDINTAREWSRKAAIGFYNEAAKGGTNADEVQYNLAECYEMNEDYKEAFEWYNKASKTQYESLSGQAMLKLGEFYNEGKGVNQDSDKAVELYIKSAKNGSYAAIDKLNELAKGGDKRVLDALKEISEKQAKEKMEGEAATQYLLGAQYYEGDGVKKDITKAIECFTKAAELGDASSYYFLAEFYYSGEGVKKDNEKAFEYYLKAAQMGYTEAIYCVAVHYYNGEGVKQDRGEAVKWYLKAAQQGHADAQYQIGSYQNTHSESVLDALKEISEKRAKESDASKLFLLGIQYLNGDGVKKDLTKAFECFLKAAQMGHTESIYNVATHYYNGDGVKEDNVKAFEYYNKAAQMGNTDAMYRIGLCQNTDSESAEWYLKAAQQGHSKAQFEMGNMYYYGYAYSKDYNKAIEWYEKAAKQGHEKAQGMYEKLKKDMSDGTLNLNELNTKGRRFKDNRDYVRAAEFFLQAAEKGHSRSMFDLGKCYYEGAAGFPKDEKKAFEWVNKAAQSNDKTAGFEVFKTLGDYYRYGVGTTQSYEKAIECYEKGSPRNSEGKGLYDIFIKECQKELKKQKGLFGGLFGKK